MAQPVASAAGALGAEVRARHVTETHNPESFAHNAAWSANYEATEDRAAATGDDIGLGGRGQPRSTGPRPAVPRIDHPATGCVHGRCPLSTDSRGSALRAGVANPWPQAFQTVLRLQNSRMPAAASSRP
jgi:hypothetical protein